MPDRERERALPVQPMHLTRHHIASSVGILFTTKVCRTVRHTGSYVLLNENMNENIHLTYVSETKELEE